MIGGDTLLWENLANQRQQYAIRDVSRVYLNPQSARTAFGYTPPVTPPATAQATSAQGITVRIDARQGWTDSGLTVNRGERLVFQASEPNRGLLGRIGNSAAFAIDTEQPIVMRTSGRLRFSVSDDERRSNRGAFSVIVSRP